MSQVQIKSTSNYFTSLNDTTIPGVPLPTYTVGDKIILLVAGYNFPNVTSVKSGGFVIPWGKISGWNSAGNMRIYAFEIMPTATSSSTIDVIFDSSQAVGKHFVCINVGQSSYNGSLGYGVEGTDSSTSQTVTGGTAQPGFWIVNADSIKPNNEAAVTSGGELLIAVACVNDNKAWAQIPASLTDIYVSSAYPQLYVGYQQNIAPGLRSVNPGDFLRANATNTRVSSLSLLLSPRDAKPISSVQWNANQPSSDWALPLSASDYNFSGNKLNILSSAASSGSSNYLSSAKLIQLVPGGVLSFDLTNIDTSKGQYYFNLEFLQTRQDGSPMSATIQIAGSQIITRVYPDGTNSNYTYDLSVRRFLRFVMGASGYIMIESSPDNKNWNTMGNGVMTPMTNSVPYDNICLARFRAMSGGTSYPPFSIDNINGPIASSVFNF